MRNNSLEGLRGAAAVLVVFFHMFGRTNLAPIVSNGYLAVDLFFVLSGFVICGAYSSRLASGADVRAFVLRRFGRLWPIHAVTTLVAIACAYAVAHAVPSSREIIAFATMTQGFALDGSLVSAVSWSAGDEFYIYLLFAAVCLIARSKTRIAVFAVLAVIGYVLCLYGSISQADCLHQGECLNLASQLGWSRGLVGFFLGAIVGEYRNAHAVRVLSHRVPQLIAAAAALLFANVAGAHGIALAAPLLFAVLVASLARDCGPVARFFQRPAFQYLGRISYSLYLGHGALLFVPSFALSAARPSPPMLLAVMLGYFAVSALLAHILNRYVETPCRVRFNAWAESGARFKALPDTKAAPQ